MPASRGSTNRNAWPQFTRPYRFSLARYTMQVAAAMTETTDMRNRCTLIEGRSRLSPTMPSTDRYDNPPGSHQESPNLEQTLHAGMVLPHRSRYRE